MQQGFKRVDAAGVTTRFQLVFIMPGMCGEFSAECGLNDTVREHT